MNVLVVGGSGGIGAAVARACARQGLQPIVAYRTNRPGSEAAIREAGRGEALHLDLLRGDFGLESALPWVEAVVHCAGVASTRRSLLDSSDAEIAELMDTHALGPLRLTRALMSPGWTETEMAAKAAAKAGQAIADIRAGHLDGRLLQPNEVAEICVRLATDPPEEQSKLVWWDRRSSRDPLWLSLDDALSFSEVR